MTKNVWTFHPENLTLMGSGSGWEYEVDLERCATSAQVLDWICQVSKKRWATPVVIRDLIRQINALLDPQVNLCSWGHERGPINVKDVLRQAVNPYRKDPHERPTHNLGAL